MVPPILYESHLSFDIREDIDYWVVLTERGSGYKRRLHIHPMDASREDPETLCSTASTTARSVWTTKDLSVFPKDYSPLCRNCVKELVGDLSIEEILIEA